MTRPAIGAGFMLFMTAQAPAHFYLLLPGDARHACHVPVALTARAAGADMNHVREINMVRHMVDPDPGDWFLFIPIRHQFFDLRSILSDPQMAGPAVGHGGDAGDGRLRSGTVTEEAGDGVIARVELMAEGNRLDRRAVPKIQRKIVHECQYGKDAQDDDDRRAYKP